MFARCGCLDDAGVIFREMKNRDLVSWNLMIGLQQEEHCALRCFQAMLLEGPSNLRAAKKIHGWIRESLLESNTEIANSLLSVYGKCESLDDAVMVFDEMIHRDIVSWNTLIAAFVQNYHHDHRAVELLWRMQQLGEAPDRITLVSLLQSQELTTMHAVLGVARDWNLSIDRVVGDALIHTLSSNGDIESAALLFDFMGKKEDLNLSSWNALIGATSRRSGDSTLEIFRRMQQLGPLWSPGSRRPDRTIDRSRLWYSH
ncbi:pentatricopeptide repeat-containing protein At1g11290, chloroplastic-like isoform X2 [Selaginella moellendorffii]|uniref:pentatricopeptide repeat-containing protein At1g11290, chloroplastic-like isoform X2 n=1 Tax=Selaginella moellendorffii TaxID=88036 RepID=UPI000D1C80C8|nr:pentatricopeptide repeat-containing protein At1g11290, chloroplastic-like isoform X2 [Selaginella moellendorffii]|eukprot:XP_024518176.1 pentatricopeptide repeat-containing protein At1g11290, chloroplastic-like isoform X2 [Selaginella moellendorffii]